MVSLFVSANDVEGDSLTYSLSGAPTGWSIDPDTGEISGVADTLGTSTLVVTVDDGNDGVDTESFAWTVSDNAIPTVGVVADHRTLDGHLPHTTRTPAHDEHPLLPLRRALPRARARDRQQRPLEAVRLDVDRQQPQRR